MPKDPKDPTLEAMDGGLTVELVEEVEKRRGTLYVPPTATAPPLIKVRVLDVGPPEKALYTGQEVQRVKTFAVGDILITGMHSIQETPYPGQYGLWMRDVRMRVPRTG